MSTPEGQISVETTTYLEYPNRVRVETKLPDALIVHVFDGKRAWVKDPEGTYEVPEAMIRELELGFRRDTVSVLLAAHDGAVRSRLLPDVKDETGNASPRARAVGRRSRPDRAPHRSRDEPDRQADVRRRGAGQPLVEELFTDYRPVDGVQIAFLAKVRRAGQLILERRITEHQDQRAARSRAVQPPCLLSPRLLLSCGEPSGDLYAGALTRELRSLAPASRSPASAARSLPPPGAGSSPTIADWR